eukprot:8585258-Karenia_brevis.AAC.1
MAPRAATVHSSSQAKVVALKLIISGASQRAVAPHVAFSQAEMAALKLTTSWDKRKALPFRPPFSQAERAAWKLNQIDHIVLRGRRPRLHIAASRLL